MSDYHDKLKSDENYIELDDKDEEGHIRFHGGKNLWFEAGGNSNNKRVYREYIVAKKIDDENGDGFDDLDDEVKNVLKEFASNEDENNPSNLKSYNKPNGSITLQQALKKAHVRLLKADTFNMQEGNIYDFGGYWNYNLGNCYVEDHMDEKAKLNDKYDHDLLDEGGPYWDEVAWDKVCSKENKGKLNESDFMIGDEGDWKKENGTTNVWVEKSFGNSYSYSEGHSIEVTKGDSLEIQHGGKHVEMVFRENGSISSWSCSDGGISKEKKWTKDGKLTSHTESGSGTSQAWKYCRDTGRMMSYSISNQTTMMTNAFSFELGAKHSASISMAEESKFEVFGGLKSSIGFSASAGFIMDIGAAANLKIKGSWGGDHAFDICSKEWTSDLAFTKVAKRAALQAKAKEIELEVLKCRLDKVEISAKNCLVRAEARKLGLTEGLDFHL